MLIPPLPPLIVGSSWLRSLSSGSISPCRSRAQEQVRLTSFGRSQCRHKPPALLLLARYRLLFVSSATCSPGKLATLPIAQLINWLLSPLASGLAGWLAGWLAAGDGIISSPSAPSSSPPPPRPPSACTRTAATMALLSIRPLLFSSSYFSRLPPFASRSCRAASS